MKGRSFYLSVVILLWLCCLAERSGAQALTGVTFSPTSLCPGGALTVNFTATGTFGTGNVFTAQLSDATGFMPVNPTVIGSVTRTTSGTINAIIPKTAVAGTGYRIRIVSSTVAKASITSAITLALTTPVPPTAATPAPYCQGASAAPLTATALAGATLQWYGQNATGGTGSSTPTVPVTTQAGTANYYVSQIVNSCESTRRSITVTVKTAPVGPTVTPVPTYCLSQTATALSATPSAGGTLNWYGTAATGGTASSVAPKPSTTQAGTTNYYVSQTLNGCESARVAIAVTVSSGPSAPVVKNPTQACLNQTPPSLTATASLGGTLNWYTAATGGIASSVAPKPTTNSLGSTTYYVSQSVSGCESPRAALTVTVSSIPFMPNIAIPSAYCEGATAQALSAGGQNLLWYGVNKTGGTGSPTATIPSTASTAIGTTSYYVTQTVNGCESARATIPVQVKDTPNAPVTSALDICQGVTVPALSISLVANATANWYGTSATGGTPTTVAPKPSSTTPSNALYYVSQTLNGCESPRASLRVQVKATPTAPGVSPISLCNNATATPLTANGKNLKWYDSFDKLLGGTPTPNTSNVGTLTYKVSQVSDDGCEGPKANLSVVVNALPGMPTVKNVSYCQAQTDQPAQNIEVLQATGQNLKWYNQAGNQLPGAPTPSIDKSGAQVYLVSQTVNNCESPRATLQVNVGAIAAPTVAKTLLVYCIDEKVGPLEAAGEPGSTLQWIDPYGRFRSDTPIPSTQNTNVNPDGDIFYVYQISSGGCYSPRAAIRVIVNAPPTLALRSQNATVNLGEKATLELKFTGSGPYSYSISEGYTGTCRRADTTIAVVPRGNTTYQVAGVSNGCGLGLPGNPATASVTVRVPTVSTNTLATTTLCAGTSIDVPFTTTGQFTQDNRFKIELASTADTSKKYSVAATALRSPVSGALPDTIPSGQYYVRVIALNSGVSVPGTDSPTPLTIRSKPTASLSGTLVAQEGMPVNLTFTFGGDGPWTFTFADSLQSYSGTATTSPYLAEVRPNKNTVYRLTSVSNNCGTGVASGTATVAVFSVLGTGDSSLDQQVKIYPMPVTTTFTVELNLQLIFNPAVITLSDSRGRPLQERVTRLHYNDFDLTGQPNGIYLVRVQVGDRQVIRKILKQ
ncbi:T9SS type A sorting domain-containing protein [Spirosoma sp. BT702]|uniref:T9SS type A sorting domain-containing protein n=1 Tax=Spirosoma profusum TaxID=2771354 RepID=A0A926Y1F4_9BACT|nr:T9SS type A sorting domain-containing protein [Spirosoma profusum]MBD2700056.1 T9SS type A sorting domain-containing protein [Spirosoma profusum]